MATVTNFLCFDERGQSVACDAYGNNVALGARTVAIRYWRLFANITAGRVPAIQPSVVIAASGVGLRPMGQRCAFIVCRRFHPPEYANLARCLEPETAKPIPSGFAHDSHKHDSEVPFRDPETDYRSASNSLKGWCGRGDSNPHDLATASPSSWCVCQFRHFRVRADLKVDPYINQPG